MAQYKIPRDVKFVEVFPMPVSSKIQKCLLRQQASEELGLQSAASIKTA